jgi:hypothetical protein
LIVIPSGVEESLNISGSVVLVFQNRANLFAQFGRIFVPVRGDRVFDRGVEHFFFRAGNFLANNVSRWDNSGNRSIFCLMKRA